jgi:hypothetical protein
LSHPGPPFEIDFALSRFYYPLANCYPLEIKSLLTYLPKQIKTKQTNEANNTPHPIQFYSEFMANFCFFIHKNRKDYIVYSGNFQKIPFIRNVKISADPNCFLFYFSSDWFTDVTRARLVTFNLIHQKYQSTADSKDFRQRKLDCEHHYYEVENVE